MNEVAFFVQQIINGLSIGIIYALMAVGLTLIFSIMDVLNFAHGELFMLGAYFCYWSIDLLGLPFMLSLVAGILVVAVISMLLERVVFRPIRGNILASIMASLGLMFVLQTLAAVAWGTISRSMHSPFKASVFRWGALFIPHVRNRWLSSHHCQKKSIINRNINMTRFIFQHYYSQLVCMILVDYQESTIYRSYVQFTI